MARVGNIAYIDKINAGMMFLALIPALLLPFELFFFVYAFLGPLHYLTEINWLHKKQYYTTGKHDYLLLVLLILAIGVLEYHIFGNRSYTPVFIFSAFIVSLGFVLFKNRTAKALFMAGSITLGAALSHFFAKYFNMAFNILLPSLIHVFIFTGLFILVGTLKSKNIWGRISLACFIFCAVLTLTVNTDITAISLSEDMYRSYFSFANLNRLLIRITDFFHVNEAKEYINNMPFIPGQDAPLFSSDSGIRVMRFIAFAYTYHYLNWFSKTSVIKWHNTKKRNLVIIAVLWIASAILYLYNYIEGLKWLYLLSMAHVILEFPLNFRSFIAIGSHFKTAPNTNNAS